MRRAEAPSLPPGPSLPRAVQTLLMWRLRQSFLRACQRRYGDVFTVRDWVLGDIVYLADPELIRQVFAEDPVAFQAGEANAPVLGPIFGPRSISVVNDPQHLRRRKILLPGFHGEVVRGYADALRAAAEREVARWPIAEPFALLPRMREITVDVIVQALVGPDRPSSELEELRDACRRLDEINDLTGLVWIVPQLERFGPWLTHRRRLDRLEALLREHIRRRRQEGTTDGRVDVLSLLVDAVDEDGRPLGEDDLRDQLVSVVVSSLVTVPVALAWTFERLVRNPAVYARAREAAAHGDRTYLDAVASEGLRTRPVFFDFLRRATRDTELAGWKLPAGIRFAAAASLIHESPELHPAPSRFAPERFLGDGPSSYTFLPFGCGSHRCLGAAFVRLEMRTVLGVVLPRTRLEPSSRAPERRRQRHITSIPARGARVVVADRAPVAT